MATSGYESPPPLLEEDPEVSRSSDSSGDEEDSVVWSESKCQDLFSKKTFGTAAECLDYCRNVHGFNMKILRKRHSMDCFSFIRFINYVRKEQPSPGLVMSLSCDTLWKDDEYMKPTIPDDPLLMFDIEEDLSDMDEDEVSECKKVSSSDDDGKEKDDDDDDDIGDATEAEKEELRGTVVGLRRQLQSKNEELELALSDMVKMRNVTKNLIEGGGENFKPVETERRKSSGVSGISPREDDGYAGGYAHFGIHHQMLSDEVRTESYRKAVARNSNCLRGKSVLDLGCGTGILSMFCAKEGAADRVVGVEMSDIAYHAMDIVMENKLDDKITILKGRLEDMDLKERLGEGSPTKFDVLISEWMGYFLLFEGMLDSVMNARDKYVASDGGRPFLILPNRCTMHLVGVSDPERYRETVEYFDDVYGYKMSCMKAPVIKEASIEVVEAEKVATTVADVHELDVHRCTLKDTEFEAEFELVGKKDAQVTAIAGYFDAFFDAPCLDHHVTFSTGPQAKPTHWKQTLFYLEERLAVRSGQKVVGRIKVTRPARDVRALEVKLSIDGRKAQKFYVD